MNENILKQTNNIILRIKKNEQVSEEDVRQAINNDITDYLHTKYHKDITFRNEVKTSVHTFIDSKYDNFVIEYKKPTVPINDKAREQLIGYLNDLDQYSWGMITNGKEIEVYIYSFEEKKFIKYDKFSGELNETQFKYICSILADTEKLILTENNINDYLGIETNQDMIRRVYHRFTSSTSEKTKLFFKEWQRLFNLSAEHDTLDEEKKKDVIEFYETLFQEKIDTAEKEYQALFSIQTYYSIVIKLVLYKIISDKNNQILRKPRIYKEFFKQIESNELYRKYNIINLIDGDFFSWYLDEFDNVEYDYLYNKISNITTIKTDHINLLFINFYENIFPFWVRHSMGEYYTPYYLAESVVKNTIENTKIKDNKIKLLDPTCGSGIFLLCAIEKKINEVYGIDINPLSVLTAKTNYLINYMNKHDLTNPLEIPIYLGDSTYFPMLTKKEGINCYEYELTTSIYNLQTIEFVFSESIIKEENFFQILDEIETQIKLLNIKNIQNILKSYKNFYYDKLKKYYDKLFELLIELEKKHLGSIWLKIIGNYLKCGSIRNVDCIVGNPPWVRWSNLPDTYKILIKKNCRVDGVFSSDTNSGGVDLNIAALITFVTIRERLAPSGSLGFIMPDSILFNKSFEGFRNMLLPDGRKYYLNKVIRWNDKKEKPFNPVTLDFGEYYFSFRESEYVDIKERKNNLNKKAFTNPNSFNNHFIVATEEDAKKIKAVLGNNTYEIHSGISLPKGGYYLLEFIRTIDDKTSEYYHYEIKGRRLSLSKEKIIIENDIVYPYIKSDDIQDNEITSCKYYCIYPYRYGDKHPYSLEEIRDNYPLFYNYFMRKDIQTSINTASKYNKRIQKNDFDVGIFRVGEYTYSDIFLATRDNTKSVFSIVPKLEMPWKEKKMPIFDGHINYLSRDEYGKPLTREKIEKLFKTFTQEGVKLYIKYSSDSRSISGRLYQDIKIEE